MIQKTRENDLKMKQKGLNLKQTYTNTMRLHSHSQTVEKKNNKTRK